MEMATLTCDIQSNPAPLFSWYKMVPGQNQRLYNGSRITITSQVPELLLLLIINWNLTCQLFWKSHGRESAKMTIFNRLFKQSCVRSKSYDNLHRGDVWKFIWFDLPHDKTNKMACAPSEESDQPGHLPSLIRAFTVCMKEPWVLSYPLSTQWRLWSDWGMPGWSESCWAHIPFCWFCHEVARLKGKKGGRVGMPTKLERLTIDAGELTGMV